MRPDDGLPQLRFSSAAAWEEWLEHNHASAEGVWIEMAKKGSGVASVNLTEALDGALSYGWIDGRRETLDDRFFLQRYTPRRARSRWSQINREKVERLSAEGRMRPAGIAKVERAKADGRWEAAYASPRNATIPEDLQGELDARPEARKQFEELNSQNRYAILYGLEDAKRPATRARRLAKFVAMLEAGERVYR